MLGNGIANHLTKTKNTNYRKLSLRKTKCVKKKYISKKQLGFILGKRHLPVKFKWQEENVMFLEEQGNGHKVTAG
jgi:hypothetical protein